MISKSNRKPSARITKGGGVEHAYRSLRRDIITLALKPGTALDEVAIATALGLSRTPVHEAIVRLAAESLVTILPNRGATVAGMEWDDIRDYNEAYGLLQRLTHRWAALRRTDAQLKAMDAERHAFEAAAAAGEPEAMNDSNWRFHAIIAGACGNRIIERNFLHVLTLSLRIAQLAYDRRCFVSDTAHREHVGKVMRDHRELVEAIGAQDPELTERVARRHAELGQLRIADTLARGVVGPWDIDLSVPD